MKAVMLAVQPKWCEKIASGEKTIEVRKSKPKLKTPFKCYIYMTAGLASYPVEINGYPYTCNNGGMNIIGEFVCDKIDEYNFHEGLIKFNTMGLPCGQYSSYMIFADDLKATCLSYSELETYGKGKTLYCWHISNLKIYGKPKKVSEFSRCCKFRNDDGSCQYTLVGCGCQVFDYNRDNSLNIVSCSEHLTIPPNSWCYVEELQGEK